MDFLILSLVHTQNDIYIDIFLRKVKLFELFCQIHVLK